MARISLRGRIRTVTRRIAAKGHRSITNSLTRIKRNATVASQSVSDLYLIYEIDAKITGS